MQGSGAERVGARPQVHPPESLAFVPASVGRGRAWAVASDFPHPLCGARYIELLVGRLEHRDHRLVVLVEA